MADNPAPTPTPAPDDGKSQTPRGKINKAYLKAVSDTEALVLVLEKPEYAAVIITNTGTEGEISSVFIAELKASLTAAKGHIHTIITKTTSKEGATGNEGDAKTALVNAIREIQKRAKQKYADADSTRQDYFIGSDIDSSRAILEACADSISKKLETDALPKIDAAKKLALTGATKAYKTSQTEQGSEASEATAARAALELLIPIITAARRKIQHAADADWPHTDATNAGVRNEFGLPRNGELKG